MHSNTFQWSFALDAGLILVGVAILYLAFTVRRKKSTAQLNPEKLPELMRGPQREESVPATAPVPSVAPKTDSDRVAGGLSKTKLFFQGTLDRLFSGAQGERFFDDLEETLLTADVGIAMAEKMTQKIRQKHGLVLPSRAQLVSDLREILLELIPGASTATSELVHASDQKALGHNPEVVMIVGVNGAGKTTSVGKLCARYRAANLKVLVGAADTFRAAATEQLRAWAERTGADGVFQKEGSDPAAVGFDSIQAAKSRNAQVCLIDTAGRLHTKSNLMEELKKMKRVLTKAMPDAPHHTWLVVDGATGQNALNQAKEFHDALSLTGLIVTKLDGSAKGGSVLAIGAEIGVPVVFIGVGESAEDLVPFDATQFIDAILDGLA